MNDNLIICDNLTTGELKDIVFSYIHLMQTSETFSPELHEASYVFEETMFKLGFCGFTHFFDLENNIFKIWTRFHRLVFCFPFENKGMIHLIGKAKNV